MDEIFNNLLDEKSLEKVLDSYADKLMAYVNAFIHDIRMAEDLVMDIFVYLIKNNLKFEDEIRFRAYVFKCARSKALDYLASKRRLVPLDDENLNDENELEEKVFLSLKKKKLYEAMEKLPTRYRQVLYLSYIEGLSEGEICEILETNKNALKSLKQRARKKLNKILKKENYIFEEGEDENK